MTKQPRWMKSMIAASTEVQVALPWARATRRRPEALKDKAQQPARSMTTFAVAAR